jgi:hypothetical protein
LRITGPTLAPPRRRCADQIASHAYAIVQIWAHGREIENAMM